MADLSYYKISLLGDWSKKEGARIVRATMSMDKTPPSLPAPKATSAPKPPKPDRAANTINGIVGAFEAFGRFKKWLDAPDPPKPASVKQEKVETIPPFDIQEIPAAMHNEAMPIGAQLLDKWFAGRLNYSPTTQDEEAEINQDGKPYPPDMYDTKIVKLDWVIKFARAKEAYEHLIHVAIYSPHAKQVIKKKLLPYKSAISDLFTPNVCGNDPVKLHKTFQFQKAEVDGTLSEKMELLLADETKRFGAPDDLTAALGSFNFYAAIGHAKISREFSRQSLSFGDTYIAEITGIWVYVKDGYTFTDGAADRSQYLGHWSRKGVITVPSSAVAALSPYVPYVESSVVLPYIDKAVSIGNSTVKGMVYYPVHNSDFRQWAIRHGRGGDFIVFADRRFVPINPTIKIEL